MNYFFEKYGRECRFLTGENDEYPAVMRAFLSPLRYKNKMYLYGVNTEIGYNPEGTYLYIGPPSPDITQAENASIACGEDIYRIDRAERVYKGEEIYYIWAVLRRTVETEENDE